MTDLGFIQSPFDRLRQLLQDVEPGNTPIDLTIGEPRHPMPEFFMAKLDEVAEQFSKYPPIAGSEELRRSISSWHLRRYGIHLDPQRNIIALNGSREGLASAVVSAFERAQSRNKRTVLIPNPFYQCYAAGALAAGGTAHFLSAAPEDGFLPNLSDLAKDIQLLDKTAALYLCSPSNPQGAVATPGYLAQAIEMARRHNFMLFADECYSEIYSDSSPCGALEVAVKQTRSVEGVVSFNSLSKRSNLPGLRSGFCAGDSNFLKRFTRYRNVAAPQVPLPIQHASAAIWADELHVEASRKLYQKKFDAADRILGERFGYRRAAGGFFIWLEMGQFGGGETAAVTLWKRTGVKVLPGAYLTAANRLGDSPGNAFIRIALVQDLATTSIALERVVDVFS